MIGAGKSMYLFISVNRHQKKYFSFLKDSLKREYGIQCRHLHTSKMPVIVMPRILSANSIEALRRSASFRKSVDVQEQRNYRLSFAMSLWKSISYFLSALYFTCRAKSALSSINCDEVILWSDSKWRQMILISLLENKKIWFMENGSLPQTTTLDSKGVNYNNSVPRDIEFYKNYNPSKQVPSTNLDVREHRKGKKLVLNEKVKLPGKYFFVPFQVDSDVQIIKHSPWIKNMEEFYALLQYSLDYIDPDIKYVIKEHPSSKQDYNHLHGISDRIIFANSANTQELIEASEGVITINSSVGIEALLLGSSVIVLGNAFYGIKGLVEMARNNRQFVSVVNEKRVMGDDVRYKFINYLSDQYLVKGNWRSPNGEHVSSVYTKLRENVSDS